MYLNLESLPAGIQKALKSKAREDKVSVEDLALTLLSDCTAMALLSSEEARKIGPATRAIRRSQLLALVPLSHTTIYEMELRGEFPSRFYLTPRCAAWDLREVLEWLANKQQTTSMNAASAHGFPGINQSVQ